jgi:hypothetical protein
MLGGALSGRKHLGAHHHVWCHCCTGSKLAGVSRTAYLPLLKLVICHLLPPLARIQVPATAKAMWKLYSEQGLSEACAALQAADEEAGFADSMPAWTPLVDALSAAVAADGAAQQAVRAAQQQPASSSGAGGADCAELLHGADAAIKQVLLWGQTAAAAQAAWAAPTPDGEHLSIFHMNTWRVLLSTRCLTTRQACQASLHFGLLPIHSSLAISKCVEHMQSGLD